MQKYKVTHCFNTEYVNDWNQAMAYIDKVLEPYKKLNPKIIFLADKNSNRLDYRKNKGHEDNDLVEQVIIYRYSTLYCEMFLIEKA
jgi:hypothetical protein